jgi:hypothetical protein
MRERTTWRQTGFLKLRRFFEIVLLGVSVVFGFGVVGSCTIDAAGGGLASSALGLLASSLFAAVFIGGVYLFTSMSRDVRLLRARYEDAAARREAHPAEEISESEKVGTGA